MTIFGRNHRTAALRNVGIAMVALIGLAAGALFSLAPSVAMAVVSAPVIG